MPKFASAAMIVNAKSRRGQDLFEQACKHLDGLPFRVDAHAVEDPARLEPTLKRVLAARPELVILGGGDGTISGLVDFIKGTGAAIAVLPLGTANSFARSLGIPLDIAGAIDVIARGELRRIDLGMIDGDYFANCAAIGLSPQIAENVPAGLKRWFGRAGYLAWAAYEFTRFHPFTLIVGEGPEAQRLRVVEVRIANGRFHGGTELIDAAQVDSGEIVVQAVQGHARRRLLRNWVNGVLRRAARHEDTIDFTGKSLRIATDPPLPISIDGEVLAHTPVTARIAAGVIDVMVPRS
ncbi:diacylglycerol kinase family protein [Sphingomonas sp. DG1-23]|uniref:diacylglycerol/lipid kinase family protein n=1 Tax=Sphingomonas sp. DG1-23 TaxID=3068316 RepID=UPI00273F2314|nr:diacylglycerol kinase family protein [Sphingomonas sp. DG1-23]MDP5278531.1 diacylglycerol kinase family protein [Sphingomonas sp. DG1-23]